MSVFRFATGVKVVFAASVLLEGDYS